MRFKLQPVFPFDHGLMVLGENVEGFLTSRINLDKEGGKKELIALDFSVRYLLSKVSSIFFIIKSPVNRKQVRSSIRN